MDEDSTGSTTKSTEATTQRIAVSAALSPVPPYAISSLFTYTTPTSSLPTSSNTAKTLTITKASSPPRKLIKPMPALIKQTPALKSKPVLNGDMT